MGRVLQYLTDKIRKGPLHMTLIDPDKSGGADAAKVATAAVASGSDAIMLGGSTGISSVRMADTARAVKAAVHVPTIIFPESPASVTAAADAIYFMSLLNSRSVDRVIRMQARSALEIQRIGLEPLALGYIIVAPGMRVGEVGEADPVPRNNLGQAQSYALAAEFLGMQLVYLEAGSGAPSPVPPEMVRAVRTVLHVPLIVGGGIRSAEDARNLLNSGAQILVTGTVTEEQGIGPAFEGILEEVRRARGE
ncbi:MAG: geranylgeranylglyceryl/heptaprenylglyceryl phosphate synthase [Thermoplasmata archaeon]|nr:geranylgeranylglyceryl/heptaprenylglyceryl phosphate synthase [Thermoplasmata archaeon]